MGTDVRDGSFLGGIGVRGENDGHPGASIMATLLPQQQQKQKQQSS